MSRRQIPVGRCTKCGAPAYNVSQISTSASGAVENAGNSNPDNDFRFDATLGSTGGYIFNLKTTGLSTGTYKVNFTVAGDSFVPSHAGAAGKDGYVAADVPKVPSGSFRPSFLPLPPERHFLTHLNSDSARFCKTSAQNPGFLSANRGMAGE
jgi:hypothetical protein